MMIKVTGDAGQCCMNFMDYQITVGEEDKVVRLDVHGIIDPNSPSISFKVFTYPEFDRVYVMDSQGNTVDSFSLHQWDPAWLKKQEERRLQQEQEEIDRLAARQKRGNDNE